MGNDRYHECPDDATVRLSFNAPVDPALVQGRLVRVPQRSTAGEGPVPLIIHPDSRCRTPPCPFLNVSLGHLRVADLYDVVLRAGAKVCCTVHSLRLGLK